MSDFQAQFDGYVKAANDAVSLHSAELQAAVPGLHPTHFRRLAANISRLLGFVDRRKAAHPEYLAASPRNIPEKAIETIAGVPVSFDSGATHFAQNVLPALVDTESQLANAVGGAAFTADQIRTQQVKAIEQLRVNAQTAYNIVYGHMDAVTKWKTEAGDAVTAIKQAATDSEVDRKAVDAVRKQADKLARGNASQNPLEKLVQSARERFDEIEKLKQTAETQAAAAENAAIAANLSEANSAAALSALQKTDDKADAILRNATQAGLAGAFKTEREEVQREQRNFAWTFYGIIAGIVIYAAVFLLPIVREALGLAGDATARESALMLFVRVVILAPVIWALIFTNKRFRYLETLQMDYAAKANTALAFSGYIDEMHDDPELQRELRRGLVRRFVEHPSRLLEGVGKRSEAQSRSNQEPKRARSDTENETESNDLDEGNGAQL